MCWEAFLRGTGLSLSHTLSFRYRPAATMPATPQLSGLELSGVCLSAFAAGTQAILHQDFPTQRDGLCQTERDFLSCPSQGAACLELRAWTCSELQAPGFQQVQQRADLTPKSVFVSLCNIL